MTVSSLIEAQRAALRVLHHEAERGIRWGFAEARQQLAPALGRFADAYAEELARVRGDADEDDGARVSPLWLHTSGHLAALRGPVVRAVGVAAQVALASTLHGQRQAAELGQTSALALMRAIPAPVVTPADDGDDPTPLVIVPPVPSQRLGMSAFNGGVPLASYFTAMPADAWATMQKSAAATVATGHNRAALVAGLLAALNGQQTQALVVGQNEATGAYRQLIALSFQANPDAVTGWTWICSFANSCAACIAMHGSVHDASETLDSHAGCACMQQPFRGQPPDGIQTGEQWFRQQKAETQQGVLGPAAYNAMRQGDISSISNLIDVSRGYVSQASLRSLGLDARDYLS